MLSLFLNVLDIVISSKQLLWCNVLVPTNKLLKLGNVCNIYIYIYIEPSQGNLHVDNVKQVEPDGTDSVITD